MTSTLYMCLFILSTLSFCVPQPNNQESTVQEENPFHRRLAPVNVDFAFRLYRNLISRAPNRNVFISPVSISMSLAMLSLGTKSTTHTQLLEGLGFNLTETSVWEVHKAFEHLIQLFNHSDTGLEMNMGNVLLPDLHLKLTESFMREIKKYYNVDIFPTDFKNTTRAKNQVNDFVKNKTLGKVDQLFNDLEENTILLLINYFLFKGRWVQPFDSSFTKMQKFYPSQNVSVDVLMMFQSRLNKILFDKELSCTVVQLEYSGNATAFFILPDEGKMDKVVAALSRDTLDRWSLLLKERDVHLRIPKFCISESYELNDVLEELGMMELFTVKADFSGITDVPIKLSKVHHKVVLSVDEEGTVAAAATGMELTSRGLPPVITFNRPFLFIVFDHFTWSSLFLGKIMNPT
ncbi:corticosteroid-binding globulin isoform X2 [Dromiciops gliroides]|nr:corticosteroid-binding globulin isoform X2 [Dromiciops gliroides]